MQTIESVTAAGAAAGGDRLSKARHVAEEFEQVFVRMMVQEMRKSTATGDDDGFFGGGPGAGTYADWFDTNMSEHLSSSGHIGIADALMRSWRRDGHVVPAGGDSGPQPAAGGV